MSLSDRFRLQEIDRIEAEKKNFFLLKKVFAICVKKGFDLSLNPSSESLNLRIDKFETSINSYYKGQLIDYSDTDNKIHQTMTISQLLEYLKTHKL